MRRVVPFTSLCAMLLVCELVWSAPYCTGICHLGFVQDAGSRNCFGPSGLIICGFSTCSVKTEPVHGGCDSVNQEPTALECRDTTNQVTVTWMVNAPCQFNFLTYTCYCPQPNETEIIRTFMLRTCTTSPCNVGG